MNTPTTVNPSNIPYGTIIMQKDHAEYGTFTVGDRTEYNGSVWYSIRGDRGVSVMHAGDFERFWKLA